MTTTEIQTAAKSLIELGFSVIPVASNKKSGPWAAYQKQILPVEDIPKKFNGSSHMAVICGQVSGNLENLDIDDIDCRDQLVGMIKLKHPDLLDKLLFTKTPNGYNVVYRCEDRVPGNLKLAKTWDTVEGPGEYDWNERATLSAVEVDGQWIVSATRLETRGESGYFLVPPSEGYEILEGSFENLQPISKSDRDSIIAIAKTFDQRPAQQVQEKPIRDVRKKIPWPGDVYSEAVNCAGILVEHGWKLVGNTKGGVTYSRPGGTKGKGSATLYDDNRLMVFSSNATPLEEGRQYSSFQLLTLLSFDGDFSESTRAVAELGHTVEMTEEEVREVLEDNPEALDDAYRRSGLHKDIISEIALDLGLEGVKPMGKVEIDFDPRDLSGAVKSCDTAMVQVPGDTGYYKFAGTIGYPNEENKFQFFTQTTLRMRSEQSVEIWKPVKSGKKMKPAHVAIPTDLLQGLLENPHTTAPEILGFSRHPTVLLDGTVVGLQDGYEEKIIFVDCEGFQVDTRPYKECYDRIVELFCGDILFRNPETGPTLFVSMMLTAMTRLMMPDGCPGYMIVANEPGTGKSTMFDFISRTVYGKATPSVNWGSNDEEREKTIISCLMRGQECFLYDNIKQGTQIECSLLAESMTGGKISARVLGVNHIKDMDVRGMFVFIGNNINMMGEFTRRILTVELLANMQNPSRRKVGIKGIGTYCEHNRKEAIGCLLKMLQEGAKMEKTVTTDEKFDFWDRVVRNPLLQQTGVDVITGLDVSVDASDEIFDSRSIISALAEVFGVGLSYAFTSKEVFLATTANERYLSASEITIAETFRKGKENECVALKDALEQQNGKPIMSASVVGKILSGLADRVIGDYRFVKHQTKSRSAPKHWIEIAELLGNEDENDGGE